METDIPGREPELTALERRLADWRPTAGALDRDRMLYNAGRAAAGVRPLRLAAAALLLVSLGLGDLAVQQRSLLGRERAVLRTSEPDASSSRRPSPPGPRRHAPRRRTSRRSGPRRRAATLR